MTTTTVSSAELVSVAAGRVARFIDVTAIAVAQRLRRRATYRALSQLDDRELDDIGLSRADVYALL
ncbi:MAG: DUF1127 domain-containing protein [Maritimibacter sp.]|nr:DUF1127 domain-containing protein [Maritimibacter sp.]